MAKKMSKYAKKKMLRSKFLKKEGRNWNDWIALREQHRKRLKS